MTENTKKKCMLHDLVKAIHSADTMTQKHSLIYYSPLILLVFDVSNAELLDSLCRFLNQRKWLCEDDSKETRALEDFSREDLHIFLILQLFRKVNSINDAIELGGVDADHEVQNALREDGMKSRASRKDL